MVGRFLISAALVLAVAGASSAQIGDVAFYDALTNASGALNAGNPVVTGATGFLNAAGFTNNGNGGGRTYMGASYTTVNPTPARFQKPLKLTKFDIVLFSATAQVYDDIQLRAHFWNKAQALDNQLVYSSSNAINPNPSDALVFPIGPLTTQASTFYFFSFIMPTPMIFPALYLQGMGVGFNWQGDTGSGYTDTNNLTTAIRGGAGSPALFAGYNLIGSGYYRNFTGRTDFNFMHAANSDVRAITGVSSLAVRFYAPATIGPEPASGVLVLAALPLLLVAKRRRARRR